MQNNQFMRPLATLTNKKTVLQIFDMPSKLGRNDNTVDVYFFHESISREHCMFECINGRYTVTDLGSTVGTFIEGFRLEPNVPYNVEDGARMKLGKVKFTFNADYAELNARNSMRAPQEEPPLKPAGPGIMTVSARELNDYEYNEEEVVYIDCGIETDNKPKIYTTSELSKSEIETALKEAEKEEASNEVEDIIENGELPNDLKLTQKLDLSDLEEDTGEVPEDEPAAQPGIPVGVSENREKSIHLEWIDDESGETKNLIISRFPFHIGRKSTENDYSIARKGVSRRHMHFEESEGEFFICDDQSTNGTKLNGIMVDSGVNTKIKAGDRIRIAGITFKVDIK